MERHLAKSASWLRRPYSQTWQFSFSWLDVPLSLRLRPDVPPRLQKTESQSAQQNGQARNTAVETKFGIVLLVKVVSEGALPQGSCKRLHEFWQELP